MYISRDLVRICLFVNTDRSCIIRNIFISHMSLIIILFLWWMSLNLGNLDTVVSFDVYGLYIFWIKTLQHIT